MPRPVNLHSFILKHTVGIVCNVVLGMLTVKFFLMLLDLIVILQFCQNIHEQGEKEIFQICEHILSD